MEIKIINIDFADLKLIETARYGDDRGFFKESFNMKDFADAGLTNYFVQDNHSRSVKGVLRGLHYQDLTAPLGKLIRCTVGSVLDVAVDLRVGSPTFGKYYSVELAAADNLLIYVPVGFAHGFLTLSDVAEVQYKCTGYYVPSAEQSIIWNDPDIAIDWSHKNPSLSEKDAAGITLKEYLANPAFEFGKTGV